jgi:hypothetical protein
LAMVKPASPNPTNPTAGGTLTDNSQLSISAYALLSQSERQR